VRPVFYFDFSPEAWLVAERVNQVLPVVPVWQPVRLASGPVDREWVRARAKALGLMPVRWPEPMPPDTGTAVLAATFAQASGRAVAFSLAAFRQAFAAGRDLGDLDNVLLAGAACELHPRALIKGVESGGVRERLRAAGEEAAAFGVRRSPTLRLGTRLWVGDGELETAAAALAAGEPGHQ
jgi:2-hydroxychromene-2-carboxylate isomerase